MIKNEKYGEIMNRELIKISVRNLVEFILRKGDIDNRISRTAEKEAMQLGSKIHRKIQKQMPSSYHAEVPLKIILHTEKYDLQLEGRADGIIEEEEIIIDEIKGVFCALEQLEEPKTVHLAQAKCYAYIYGQQKGLEEISVQMTYCNLDTEEIKRFKETYRLEELEIWFDHLINEYKKWTDFQMDWKKKRNTSIKKIDFPYTYRKGQKDLAISVYKTILRKKKLFIQAPTGVGKTIATVFPSVKAIGEGLGEKIFYLTAKTITRTVVEQGIQLLNSQGLQCKVITLTAKEKICFSEEKECNPEKCPYAKGHYDRVNNAVYDMIITTNEMSRENIEFYAQKHKVCPFEMSLDVALWTDIVICDYNYVFDPNAHLRRFFSDEVKGEYIFLIDEAHNLVERGREMYSATIFKEEFLEAKRIVKNLDRKLERKLDICNRELLELKRSCKESKIYQSIGQISIGMTNLLMELERFMEECERKDVKDGLLEFFFHVRTFLNVYDILDENYKIYGELDENEKFKLKLFCVNPATNLQKCLEKGNSTIFFSATFLPIYYYKQLLSTEKDDYAIYIDSPFEQKNREIIIGSDVSSKYTLRNVQMYKKIASYIMKTLEAKKGNYIAFFPSYQFMENVYEVLEENRLEKTTYLLQEKIMTEEKREEFLDEFSKERNGNLLGLCVMGGIFSEGIDLTEERLVGAFVVGTGIPQICHEREILRGYFEEKNGKGFEYAYLYPGMNKVLQSAGRVIRTEKDRGIILLLDDRFLQRQCREIFPKEWLDIKRSDLDSVGKYVEEFWERNKNEK